MVNSRNQWRIRVGRILGEGCCCKNFLAGRPPPNLRVRLKLSCIFSRPRCRGSLPFSLSPPFAVGRNAKTNTPLTHRKTNQTDKKQLSCLTHSGRILETAIVHTTRAANAPISNSIIQMGTTRNMTASDDVIRNTHTIQTTMMITAFTVRITEKMGVARRTSQQLENEGQ